MKLFNFSYQSTAITDQELQAAIMRCVAPKQLLMNGYAETNYETPYSFMYLPFDTQIHDQVKQLVARKKKLNPSLILVIGIGGSHLGTAACYKAASGTDYIPLEFLDTISPQLIMDRYHFVEALLQSGRAIIVNIISKSGSTLETMVNAEIIINLLKKMRPDNYQDYVVVTTDYDSALWRKAKQHTIDCLAVPKNIGGRFSVLSPVGLFPLALTGINIERLCYGAQQVVTAAINNNWYVPEITAALLFLYYQRGTASIHDLFLFEPSFEMIGKWYRQLFAESLGKEESVNGKKVHIGFLPTVSIGSTDLHSVAQLYLSGPDNRFTTFVHCETYEAAMIVPDRLLLSDAIQPVQSAESLYHIIFNAVTAVYSQQQRPFITVTFPRIDLIYLGQFMQYAMIHVAYLGSLLDINTFDQPAVELYKTEIKKMLRE